MTKLLKLMATVTVAAAGITVGAWPADALAQGGAPVKMVLISQSNEAGFPMWLAKKLNYFSGNGIDATIKYFPNGGAALASGAAGDWQGGWIGSPPAITGYAKFGLTPVGTMMKEDRNIKLIMRKDALKGSSPAQVLVTKQIGSVPNSTWSQVLYACAKHFKVDPGKMKVVPLEPPVTRQSLRSGEIAAGTTDSSPDIDLVNDKENFEVVCDGAVAGTSVVDPWIVTKKFATENPAAAAAFVEAGFRASELIMKDREKAVAYLLEFYKDVGIDGDEKKARYTLGYRDYQTLDQALADARSGASEKALTETAQVFVAGGAYDKVPDLKSAIGSGLPILEAAKKLRK
ncbi:ABC transporter substrate-binding protein [Caenimonas aquaedulcis]|uniref:ABC transporter substrate-binding protein n=1 Tax=Caenimonas aquaedulcis TaxID=2793270 RepID=A0A931MJ53_9BURK|nr:ABC transporter substrate-binding protein [Caenimonas aquaedulcis]MBG9390544.1 ABC transporter substrate-binding protein [Caenimonas aquaedulcis]